MICLVQVKRWARQYRLSVQAGAQPLGEMLALIDWLQDHIPPGDEDPAASRLSHGDFRCRLSLGKLFVLATFWTSQRRHAPQYLHIICSRGTSIPPYHMQ
jgi:hypothetical protein